MIEETMLHGQFAETTSSRRAHRQRLLSATCRDGGNGDASVAIRQPDAPATEQPIFRTPPGWSGPMRVSATRRIELDTPILPGFMAEGVCEEVAAWFQSPVPLPRHWAVELAGYANTIYAHNERFRRRIRGGGNRGRDYLQAFMRHWLAAMLKDRRPELFDRLPASFCVGQELPSRHGKLVETHEKYPVDKGHQKV